ITTGPGADTHGFLRTAEGAFFIIDVPGAYWTAAWKISPRGQIVGAYQSADGKNHVFQISMRGLLRDPSDPPFTTIHLPDHIDPVLDNGGSNARGEVVGAYCDTAPCEFASTDTHGFLLSRGELHTIDNPSAVQTFAFGINAAGDIVGSYVDAGNSLHAFLLSQEETRRRRRGQRASLQFDLGGPFHD